MTKSRASGRHIPSTLEDFVAGLAAVPWFANVGKRIEGYAGTQLETWDAWPGPEHPHVERIHLEHQAMRDAMLKGSDDAAFFDEVVMLVVTDASKCVTVDPDGDAWDPRSTAVWQAGWTAALVAAHLKLGMSVPPSLGMQWEWFPRGHWPSAYESDEGSGYVVY